MFRNKRIKPWPIRIVAPPYEEGKNNIYRTLTFFNGRTFTPDVLVSIVSTAAHEARDLGLRGNYQALALEDAHEKIVYIVVEER